MVAFLGQIGAHLFLKPNLRLDRLLLSRAASAAKRKSFESIVPYRFMASVSEAPKRPKSKVAVAQLNSTDDIEANFTSVRTLVAEASKQGVQFVCFPETFAYLGYQGTNPVTGDNNITKKPGLSEPLSGPLFTRYQHLAKEFNIWISYGGFQETSHVENKTFNAHVIVKPDGEIADVYRKVHLFDCPYAALFESRNYVAGDDIKVIDTPFGRIGLAICYDLRFSAHFEAMRSLGVEIILIPAAFTKKTGIAHWHILQRARAIETQCYVISAAQGGVHNPKRESFGHALIIDPFGRVLADIEEGVGLAVAEIDLEYLDQVRREIPTSQHRRFDVYAKYDTAKQ